MSQVARGPVVIDTGVFGARLTLRTRPLATLYEPLVKGHAALISFVTVAELRFGARLAGWGPERRQSLERQLARAETVWPGPNLADTYAVLRVWCVRNGHGLGQKDHELTGGSQLRRSGWASLSSRTTQSSPMSGISTWSRNSASSPRSQ